MLPGFLTPSYKQYKTDTDATNRSLPKALPPGDPRAKPEKARENQNGSASQGPKHLLSVDEFIKLAEWIREAPPSRVDIPHSFVVVLNRAIMFRKRHNNWWYTQKKEKSGVGDNENESNASHGHFIGVLEQVRQILQPLMPGMSTTNPAATKANAKSPPDSGFVNSFQHLDLEEPSDALLNAEPMSSPVNPANTTHVQYSVQQPDNLEEVFSAVHCLLYDFHNIRRYIQRVWKGYAQGGFDLVTASLTSDAAMDFVRHLHDGFIRTFPNHADFRDHMSALYAMVCKGRGLDPQSKERPDDDMNFSVYKRADELLISAYMLISSFEKAIKPGALPVYKPGQLGIYDPSSDRESKSSREKFHEDKIILLEFLPDFCILAIDPNGGIPAEDEMICGIRQMCKTGTLPFWLVFATQIFLDIHHILRSKVSMGRHYLVQAARHVEHNIKQNLKFHENLRIERWPRANDKYFRQILEEINEWVNEDMVQNIRTGIYRRRSCQAPPVEPFNLMSNHPLYCGLLAYQIKILSQDVGIAFVDACGSVTCAAHLYNAVRQERLISNPWKDMDLALMHRHQEIFVGDFPKTTEDYFKRYCLTMGYSASNFAKNRRKRGGMVISKAGPRRLNRFSPVANMLADMFKGRYSQQGNRTNLSPEGVKAIYPNYADGCANDDEDPGEWTTRKIKIDLVSEPTQQEAREGSRKMPGKEKTIALARIWPIQVLNALLGAVQSEIRKLNFDLFCLHRSCWTFLQTLKNDLDVDLCALYGPDYLDREGRLPFVVGYIFTAALEGSVGPAELLAPPKNNNNVVATSILAKAASTMKEMLESGAGGVEVEQIKDFLGMQVDVPDLFNSGELEGR